MSQSPVSPHFAAANPSFQHDKDISLPIPSHCHPTPLLSSPVTPPAAPRWRFTLPPLPHQHTAVLRSFRDQASRHRPTDMSLLREIAAVGNVPYLKQRHVIIQWMIDVATTFHFLSTTLHLAVRHVDAFMATRILSRNLWQLVAVSAIFIAAKCEESSSRIPALDDLKFICDNAFDHAHIRQMEVCMLRALDWDLVVKTPVHFCNQFITTLYTVHDMAHPGPERVHNTASVQPPRMDGSPSAQAPSPSIAQVQSTRPLNVCLDDADASSSDGEMENYSYVSTADSDSGACDCPVAYCACETLCPDQANRQGRGDSPSRSGIPASDENATQAISPVSTPEGPRDVRERRSNPTESAQQAPFRSVVRTATCFLDVSLHEPSLRTRYAPDVLAAAALDLATSVGPVPSMGYPISTDLIAHISELSKDAILDCRVGLWSAFVEAQK